MRLATALVLAALCLPARSLAQEGRPEGLQDLLFELCLKLQGAALANDLETLEEQFDFGANLECRMRDEFDGATSLIIAAAQGNANAVDFLVENGANVNARDRLGLSALRHARAGLEGAREENREMQGYTRTIEILEQANAEE